MAKKKPKSTSIDPAVHLEIKNEAKHMVANGLTDAILGFNPLNFGGVELSQTDTLFKNLRWYLVSNMRQLLSEVYVESGLIQTVVDVPVDDGIRGGIEIRSKQLDPEEVEKLEQYIEREDFLNTVARGCKWTRLYGGGGLVIITDQDPLEPLDISKIDRNTPLEFNAVDMWELFWDKQNVEGMNPARPTSDPAFDFYSYYDLKLHKSRVMKMKGLTAPSFIRPRLRGWGFSIVESVVRSINQYLKEQDLAFEVLDEFKLDIFKIKNLANTLLNADGTATIQRRVQLANQQKNYQNAITMDSEDDYIQKQLSFSGLAETMKEIRMQVACDLRMPLTKIFGISAQGFNSGEDDIENYNSMVESQVRSKMKYHILKGLELYCQKLFGMVPDDLQIDFKPLRIMSSEQEENVKTQRFSRLLMARQAGEITTEEFRDGCNKDDLFPIKLEKDVELEDEVNDAKEGDDEEEKPEEKKADKAPKSTLGAKEAKSAKNNLDEALKDAEKAKSSDQKRGGTLG